jgi:hypothetical protein
MPELEKKDEKPETAAAAAKREADEKKAAEKKVEDAKSPAEKRADAKREADEKKAREEEDLETFASFHRGHKLAYGSGSVDLPAFLEAREEAREAERVKAEDDKSEKDDED